MSIIFGLRQPTGQLVNTRQMLNLAKATECFAPAGTQVLANDRVGMGYQPIHSHERSSLERQPILDADGNMLCLDGRIDNHEELRKVLGLEPGVSDSVIVLAAFLRWREDCFSRLIGDWALGLWSSDDRLLYLVRDHAGTRTLYYENAGGVIRWATYLEALVADSTSRSLNPEYAAAYLGSRPIGALTPYQGIHSAPAAHYLVFAEGSVSTRAHWNWMVGDTIRYSSDATYDEQFLTLFAQAVDRRTGPGAPVLAHLSGGMDSTSIVCMSDHIRRSRGASSADLLDTLSLYDEAEPNWNERPYFSIVEERRGKRGIHIEVSPMDRTFEPLDSSKGQYLLPGADSGSFRREEQMEQLASSRGYRAILAGYGGDELLGGVPTPFPELANHLAGGHLGQLLRRTTEWCIAERKPLGYVLLETAKFTFHLYRTDDDTSASPTPWIHPDLNKFNAAPRQQWMFHKTFPNLAPSSIANGRLWWGILETLPHLFPTALTRFEYRYPYLDRDLVDFLFRIPREQLVQPGRRRFLMRRALKGIVPTEILERRRKAFLVRGPLASIQNFAELIRTLLTESLVERHGFVDIPRFRTALESVVTGEHPEHRAALMRTIGFELWLRSNSTELANLAS